MVIQILGAAVFVILQVILLLIYLRILSEEKPRPAQRLAVFTGIVAIGIIWWQASVAYLAIAAAIVAFMAGDWRREAEDRKFIQFIEDNLPPPTAEASTAKE